jgi:hypothetical protein
MKGSGRGLIYGTTPEGLRKTTKNLSQESRSPGQDLNRRTVEYEAGVLSSRLRLSI